MPPPIPTGPALQLNSRCLSLLLLLLCVPSPLRCNDLRVVPRPVSVTLAPGTFTAKRIVLSPDEPPVRATAERLAAALARPGHEVSISPSPTAAAGDVVLRIAPTGGGPESYTLAITTANATLTASTPAGLARGVATLDQLTSPAGAWPALDLADHPRFGWRGVLIDVARHFRSAAWVHRLLDAMALHKLNVLHWHLTDDQGWRIPVRARPKLATAPAYTAEEIRGVLAHAKALSIEVIPEIDMPGHVSAALAAYPELSCTGSAPPVPTTYGTFEDVLCIGNPETYAFADAVFAEVARLFPAPRVHLGGDEVPRRRWEQCARCLARAADARLRGPDELQRYFTWDLAKTLARHGRLAMVWDDDRVHGFPPDTTVQAWHGDAVAMEVLRAGDTLIASPEDRTYLNRDALQLPLERVLAFEPVPRAASAAEAARVLGAEACLWGERTVTDADAERRLFPRLAAFAEAVWSPQRSIGVAEFQRRAEPLSARLARMGMAAGHPGARAGMLSPRELSQAWRGFRFDVTAHVTGPGVYRVALGAGAPAPVEVRAMRLLAGGLVHHEARRLTSTTAELPERVYELRVLRTAPGDRWELEVDARAPRRGAAVASVWLDRDDSTSR